MSRNENDGAHWWQQRLGIKPQITEGEKTQIAPDSNENNYLYSQEKQDALKLIQLGNRINDPTTTKVGQARLRILEGRPTAEDLELLFPGD